VNRCAAFEQPSHCVLFVRKGEIARRQRHQRRCAPRQQHDQEVVVAGVPCNLQRTACGADTALIGNWMSGIEPRCFRWQPLRLTWSDADRGSHAGSGALYELGQHRTRGFTHGDDVDCRRSSQRVSDRVVGNRGPDERRRIRCTNGCTEDVV